MPFVKPARDQFCLEADKIYHRPTEAWWSAYATDPNPSSMHLGLLGVVLDNGDEYEIDDVQEMALAILRKR